MPLPTAEDITFSKMVAKQSMLEQFAAALDLISKALREDVSAIKEIFDSAYGKPKAEEAQFEPWTVIMP